MLSAAPRPPSKPKRRPKSSERTLTPLHSIFHSHNLHRPKTSAVTSFTFAERQFISRILVPHYTLKNPLNSLPKSLPLTTKFSLTPIEERCSAIELLIDCLYSQSLLSPSNRHHILSTRSISNLQVRFLLNCQIYSHLQSQCDRIHDLIQLLLVFCHYLNLNKKTRNFSTGIPLNNELQILVVALSTLLQRIKSFFKDDSFHIPILSLFDDDDDQYLPTIRPFIKVSGSTSAEQSIVALIDQLEMKLPRNRGVSLNFLNSCEWLRSESQKEQVVEEFLAFTISPLSSFAPRPRSATAKVVAENDWDEELVADKGLGLIWEEVLGKGKKFKWVWMCMKFGLKCKLYVFVNYLIFLKDVWMTKSLCISHKNLTLYL
ncbi:hypothetical protein GEMRC1_008109 [Eukaryota sp. GEM-RC1]